jgi:hypothetical protein
MQGTRHKRGSRQVLADDSTRRSRRDGSGGVAHHQPNHVVPHRTPARCRLGGHHSRGAATHRPHDRRAPAQHPVHLAQDARPGARDRRPGACGPSQRRPARIAGRAQTERPRDRSAAGGNVPPSKGYVWRNLSLDVPHVLAYFVAHEGHHRGQIVMLARQLGHRLPAEVAAGLWQWTQRSREARR